MPLEPKDANLHYNLGQCYDRLGQSSQAETCYKQCLELNPNHPECRARAGGPAPPHGRPPGGADEMIQDWLISQPASVNRHACAEDGWRLCGKADSINWQLDDSSRRRRITKHAITGTLVELGQLYEENQQPALWP